MEALRAVDLTCAYGEHTVVTRLSLAARAGEVLGLIGPNGAGKTTVLRALARLLRPREGSVYLGEREVWRTAPGAVARNLALAPQANPSWPLTVEQVVLLGRAPHRGWLLPMGRRDADILEGALRRTGLWEMRGRSVGELSGGEQKRVILARALCQEPRVLLLDEPTAYLDLKYQAEILALVRRLAHDDGLTVVVTLHDLNQAALYADRLALLYDAHLVAAGAPHEVLTAEHLSAAYGVPVVVCEHPVHRTPLVTPLPVEEGAATGGPA